MSSILDALRKSELERQKTTGQDISLPYPATIKQERESHLIPALLKIVVVASIGLAIWWMGFTTNNNPAANPPAATPPGLQPKPVVANPEVKSLPKPVKRMEGTHQRAAKAPPQPAAGSQASAPVAAVPNTPGSDPLKGLPPLDIAGFMHNEQGNNMAIINDKLMKEGDEVSPGLRVEKIKEDSVIFSYKGYVFSR